MTKRVVLHLDVDNFYVAVEVVHKPELNGLPVIIVQKNSGGIVALSNEAKKCGIETGEGIGRAGNKALKRKGRAWMNSPPSHRFGRILTPVVPSQEDRSKS